MSWRIVTAAVPAWVAAAAIAAAGCGSAGGSATEAPRTATNLEVMRTLVAGIGADIIDSTGIASGDTVFLGVDSTGSAWLTRTELAAALGRAGVVVVTGAGRPEARTRWTVGGTDLRTEYSNVRRPGLFEAPVLDRTVSASFSVELTRDGGVAYAGTARRTSTDTVPEDLVPALETASPEDSRGRVPEMLLLDRFVEPIVIIGAAGAAIFLFFQVRS